MTSYQKTKSGIVGTWVMDGYQGTGDLGTPYTSLGWNDPWPYEKQITTNTYSLAMVLLLTMIITLITIR